MKKLIDIRCYVTPSHKQLIKQTALDRNISVNKLLREIIDAVLPEPQESKESNLKKELESILVKLSNSADLPYEEREQLKRRKKEIKTLLKGEQL